MSDAHQRWSERLSRYHTTDQTVAAFCAAERVSETNFYHWKAKLERPKPTSAPPIPIQLTADTVAPGVAGSLELVFPSGLILRLPGDSSPEQLATLIAAVEARSC